MTVKTNTEYERKQLITQKEYDTIKSKLEVRTKGEEVVQINYYYDDPMFSLNDEGETLRVRQKGAELFLERKFNKHYSASGVKVCDEYEEKIEQLPINIKLGEKNCSCIGSLVTIRTNYILEPNIISLDINYYLGKVDYEIEIESVRDVIVPEFLNEILSFRNNQEGKYSRFIKQFTTLNGQIDL